MYKVSFMDDPILQINAEKKWKCGIQIWVDLNVPLLPIKHAHINKMQKDLQKKIRTYKIYQDRCPKFR